MNQPYFLTGALGCIGAWIVKQLVERGDRPWVFDAGMQTHRLEAILDQDGMARVELREGDVTDGEALCSALEESGARKILHLAGLQVPTCRADPIRGATVNVLGTLQVFEAARATGAERVVYASSAAVYGDFSPDLAVDESVRCEPATHYGVFKRANEGNARVYHLDHGLSSVGLRPLTVYGVGRDQGLTSDPTRAMKAAILGRPFHVRFSGSTDFLFVDDAAAAFLTCADRAPEGAHVFNLHGDSVRVEEFIDVVRSQLPAEQRELITVDGPAIPIAPQLDGSAVTELLGELPRTPIVQGIHDTLEGFRRLRDEGRLLTHDLED